MESLAQAAISRLSRRSQAPFINEPCFSKQDYAQLAEVCCTDACANAILLLERTLRSQPFGAVVGDLSVGAAACMHGWSKFQVRRGIAIANLMTALRVLSKRQHVPLADGCGVNIVANDDDESSFHAFVHGLLLQLNGFEINRVDYDTREWEIAAPSTLWLVVIRHRDTAQTLAQRLATLKCKVRPSIIATSDRTRCTLALRARLLADEVSFEPRETVELARAHLRRGAMPVVC